MCARTRVRKYLSGICFRYGYGIHAYYGVASFSRIHKITGLFCKRALQKRQYSAKETCRFIDPTDCSHPICAYAYVCMYTHVYVHR